MSNPGARPVRRFLLDLISAKVQGREKNSFEIRSTVTASIALLSRADKFQDDLVKIGRNVALEDSGSRTTVNGTSAGLPSVHRDARGNNEAYLSVCKTRRGRKIWRW